MGKTINHLGALLSKASFKKTVELLRACSRVGAQAPRTKTDRTGIFDTVRGIAHYAMDPATRATVRETVDVALKYSDSKTWDMHSKSGGHFEPTIVAKLIAHSHLARQKLKILDVGCHYGYLIDSLKEHPDLTQNIHRYRGIDFSFDTVSNAQAQMNQRFKDTGCKDYQFVVGDALVKSSFEDLPKDNNIIVCTGLSDHFKPQEIKTLLTNLKHMLSDSPDARIFLGYNYFEDPLSAHTKNTEELRGKILEYLHGISKLGGKSVRDSLQRKESFIRNASHEELINFCDSLSKGIKPIGQSTEDGIIYTIHPLFNDYKVNAYDRKQFEKLIASCGFEIEIDNSHIRSISICNLGSNHLCLKRKS